MASETLPESLKVSLEGEKTFTFVLHRTTEKRGDRTKVAYWVRKNRELPSTAPSVKISPELADSLIGNFTLDVDSSLVPIDPELVKRDERPNFVKYNTTKKGTDQYSARKFFRLDEENFLIVNVSVEIPSNGAPTISLKGTCWKIPAQYETTGERGRKAQIADEDTLEEIFS